MPGPFGVIPIVDAPVLDLEFDRNWHVYAAFQSIEPVRSRLRITLLQ